MLKQVDIESNYKYLTSMLTYERTNYDNILKIVTIKKKVLYLYLNGKAIWLVFLSRVRFRVKVKMFWLKYFLVKASWI